jgi:ABC-2 type transport system permease protein
MSPLREVLDYRQFLREYTLMQFRSRYRSSALGFAWTLLVPLATLASFSFVFFFISGVRSREFGPFFFGGFLMWSLMAAAAPAAIMSIVGSPQYITRIHAPKSVFPVSAFIVAAVEFLAFGVAVLLILAALRVPLGPTVALLPISVLIYAPFVLGICFLFASANVFFRDFAFLWTSLNMLWLFLTPVFYRLESVPPTLRPLFEANPLYPFSRLFQDPLLGRVPSGDLYAAALLYSALALMVGIAVFRRTENRFYLYL